MDSEKRKQKFWGYGFRFFSAQCFLKFGEIRNSARRRGLGRHAGTFLTGFLSRKNNLKKAISDAISDNTTALDIEVGYFYLCGFELLSKKLDKLKVRILVGSYIDPDAIPTLITETTKKTSVNIDPFQPRSVPTSKQERVRAFGEGIKKLANQTSIFDAPESQETYTILERKLEEGSLEIKMTEEQSHGKYYVIHNKT